MTSRSRPSPRRLLAALVASLLGLAALAVTGPATAQQDSAPVSIWRVYVDEQTDINALNSGEYDLVEGRGPDFLLVVGDDAVGAQLRRDGFRTERDRQMSQLPAASPNVGDRRSSQFAAAAQTFYGGYRTVDEHYAHLDSVASSYPGLSTVYDYGDSWLKVNNRPGGNDLRVICLTNKQSGDCARNPNSAKPRAVIMAAIHSRELQTSEMAYRLIDELTQKYGSDPDITHLMDTTETWIIPVANPDGREIVESGGNRPYLQRKNANDSRGNCSRPPTGGNQHGVDLNRNATFGWGGIGTSTNPCSAVYRGTSASSEPEQAALENLFDQLWPDTKGGVNSPAAASTRGTFITIHSFSELILLPPGAGGLSPNDTELRKFAFRMSHYNGYETGTGPEILYGVTGSTDDHVYYTLGVPSFTYELSPPGGSCGGFTPPYRCIEPLWNLNKQALLYSVRVAESPYSTAQGPTTTGISVTGSVAQGESAVVTATVNDNAYGNSGISRPSASDVTAAEYYVGSSPLQGGSPVAMASSDGSFNEANEGVQGSIDTSSLAPGTYSVYVRGRNANGFWGPVAASSFTVTEATNPTTTTTQPTTTTTQPTTTQPTTTQPTTTQPTTTTTQPTTTTTGPVVGLPFIDDFESGAGNWSSLGGNASWSIYQGRTNNWFRGQAPSGGGNGSQVAGEPGWGDYAFEVEVITTGTSSSGVDGPGILARVVDADNHYRFRYDNRRWWIEKVQNGSVTTLAQSSDSPIFLRRFYDVRAEVEGSTLRLYVDGDLKATAQDSTFSSGRVGVGVWGVLSYYDDASVTALP